MIVNIIGKANGVGLSRDFKLLTRALEDCGCHIVTTAIDDAAAKQRRSVRSQMAVKCKLVWNRLSGNKRAPKYDVNVMLEHIWPPFLSQARANVVVPNPEWFDRHDQRFLGWLDRVWAKTDYTVRVFERLGYGTTFVGFDSEDRFDATVARESTFFHLAGKSTMKGTARLVDLWLRHPEWPKLVLVQHSRRGRLESIHAPNIECHMGYLPDESLRRLQNVSRFHLCLSETEGWGHYIVEALSVGAVTLTVDARPMSELVTSERGVLVSYESTDMQRLAQTYRFEVAALEMAITQILGMDEDALRAKSRAAREWFLRNKEGFVARLNRALNEHPGQTTLPVHTLASS